MPLHSENTLAHYQMRSLVTHTDWSEIPCSVVAEKMKAYMAVDVNGDAKPETLALEFYGLNHAYALIQQKFDLHEPLPEEAIKLVDAYFKVNTPNAIRAAYYLLWICIREARHGTAHSGPVAELKDLLKPHGDVFMKFMSNIHGGEHGISQKFIDNPPDMPIGKFSWAVEWQFTKFGYGGSFGGVPWQQVNNCLTRMIRGEFSPEMMLDVVWTLAHNGGPIFNKGQFFGMYGQELYYILDVQRSGQIPEYVLEQISGYATKELFHHMELLRELFPDEIGDYVDWYKVEGLGAVHKYPNQKKEQVAKHGYSEWAQKAEAAKIAAEKQKALEEKLAKEEFEKNYLVLMPGVHVKKVPRPKAA